MSGLAELKGKIAVVTGGASGIGLGIARQLVAEGMQVVIADVEEARLQQSARDIGAIGIRTDVSNAASVQALAQAVCERYGTVHVLVNNAGVGPSAPIANTTLADWDWIIGVNLRGVIHGVAAFLPVLKANPDGGHIVNTSSVGGLVAAAGLGAYSVTKFGVTALTEALAQELAAEGSKVGATLLCPGTVRTDIKNSRRNLPAGQSGGGLADFDLEQTEMGKAARWLEPQDVGVLVVESIRRGDLYTITHPEMYPMIKQRFDGIAHAFEKATH